MTDHNNNAEINMLEPNNSNKNSSNHQKKGFRKIFSEMVRQAKSPKLPRIRSINNTSSLERNSIDEDSDTINNNKDSNNNQNQLLAPAATLPRRRAQSTSSARSLIYRRRQPSLSNKELERIALKYKRSNTTPPPSRSKQGESEGGVASSQHNNINHLKFKTWSSPPLGFVEQLNNNDDSTLTGPFKQSSITNRTSTTTRNNANIPAIVVNKDNCNFLNVDYSKTRGVRGGNRPKLYRQQTVNNNLNIGAITQHQQQHRKLTKSQSADHASASTSASSCRTSRFEKDEIQAIVRTEINKVIALHTKYEEILVQKWSKDICTKVRDHIRLRTGRYIKVIVNSMIGTVSPIGDQGGKHATCNILSSIQSDDQFVVTVVKSEELFVSVWVLISP